MRAVDTGSPTRGLEVSEAAAALGISVAAVRKRIRRGSLRAFKVAGVWRVLLPAEEDARGVHGEDGGVGRGESTGRTAGSPLDWTPSSDLVASLHSEVAFLRRQLEDRGEELRRKDHIILSLAQQQNSILRPLEPAEPAPRSQSPSRPDRPGLGETIAALIRRWIHV